MGWRTVADVRDHSQATGSTYIVAIMLAERAADETRTAWPGLRTLAVDSRVNRSTVQRALRKLVEAGEIEVVDNAAGGRGKTTAYRIVVGTSEAAQTPSEKGPQVATLSQKRAASGTQRVAPRTERAAPRGPNLKEPTKEPKAARAREFLAGVARSKGAELPTETELARIADAHPEADTVAEAERFRLWHQARPGVPIVDFARSWSGWLAKAPAEKAKPWRADPDAEDQHAERLDWAREHLPDLEPELVAGCYLTALGRFKADRGPEPTPELIRQRLEAQGRAKAVA